MALQDTNILDARYEMRNATSDKIQMVAACLSPMVGAPLSNSTIETQAASEGDGIKRCSRSSSPGDDPG